MRCLTAISFAALVSAPVYAAELDIIVDRKADAVEVFVSLAATDIPAVFGNATDFIAPTGVIVAYDDLREGTWDQGDAMIAGTQLNVGADAVALEAMSLMVHPKDAPMPFGSVADAYLAMSVCNGFAPGTVPTIDILHAYAGYIAYPVDGTQPLSFTLQNSEFVSVTIKDMYEGSLISEQAFKLVPSGTITLRTVEPQYGFVLWQMFATIATLAGLVLVACGVQAVRSAQASNKKAVQHAVARPS